MSRGTQKQSNAVKEGDEMYKSSLFSVRDV